MSGFFECNHPFNRLVVEKEHTVENIDADFNRITYHLVCQKCKKLLPLSHAEVIGSTTEFLNRGN